MTVTVQTGGIASSAAPAAFLQNPLASHILAAIIGWVFQAFDRTASSAHFAFSLSAHTIGAVLILIGNRVFVSAIVIPSGSTGVSACSAPGCLAGGLFCFFLAIGAQNPALSLTGCAQKTAVPVTIFALDQAAAGAHARFFACSAAVGALCGSAAAAHHAFSANQRVFIAENSGTVAGNAFFTACAVAGSANPVLATVTGGADSLSLSGTQVTFGISHMSAYLTVQISLVVTDRADVRFRSLCGGSHGLRFIILIIVFCILA